MLDSHTTLILAALLFWMLPLLVWWTTGGRHTQAVAWWCAGSVLAGLGIVLMGLRPWVVPWLSFQGGNTCLLLSFVGWSQSLRVLRGRPWHLPHLVLWALLALTYYSVLLLAFDPQVRGMGMRWALGGLAIYTACLAWPLAQRWRSHNAAAIALSYGVLGLGLWAQSFMHTGDGVQPSPFSQTWDASLIALLALLTSTIGHFCYTGMVLDHATQSRARVARAQAAAEETAKLETQLRQLDRQERMVLVSGALAHELNQPLTAALTQAQVAQRRLLAGRTEGPVMVDLLRKVVDGIERASRILVRIRRSGQHNTVTLQRIDARAVVNGALDLLDGEWHRLSVRVDRALGDTPLWCQADGVALSQVLVNVLRNAGQAMEHCPHRWLQVSAHTDGTWIRVRVRDHGTGVSAQVLAQWGEPFVSTREHGLGMGLAISRAIMAQHRGDLSLRNHPGGGAEAVLSLPQDAGGKA